MKQWMKKALCGLMAMCMLLSPVCAAGQPTDGYVLPDNWAKNALIFAVENGILQGRENGDLDPTGKTTRAEAAAVLVRLLGASGGGDLSGYQDVDKNAWYYQELGTAAAMGIFRGVSQTSMAPNQPITRQEIFTAIARTLGMHAEEDTSYRTFRDATEIKPYARDAISALVESGSLKGYEDGTLRPRNPVSRQELASVLYHLLDQICDDPKELKSEGFLLYRGTEPLPAGYTLQGSLILGASLPDSTLTELNVSGTTYVRCQKGRNLTLDNCRLGVLAVATAVNLTGTGEIDTLSASAEADVALSAKRLLAYAPGHFSGSYDTAVVYCSLDFPGQAGQMTLEGDNLTLSGTGYADTVTVHGRNCTVTLPCGKLEQDRDYETALSTVQTVDVEAVTTCETPLYSSETGSSVVRYLPANTKLFHLYYPGDSRGWVETMDGQRGFVRWADYTVSTKDYTQKKDYSRNTKEGFVNQKGYESDTSWLIWVSLKTQMVNIFHWEDGQWTLHRTAPCSTGKNTTPTTKGQSEIHYWSEHWNFTDYRVYWVTGFHNGEAFHSITYDLDGNILDGTLGTPASHGCVRMAPEECRYIYDEMPKYTAVVVY